MNYVDILKKSAKVSKNCACMGLDPILEFLPKKDASSNAIISFFETLFNKMKERGLFPSAFKPNIGYYVVYDNPFENDFSGSIALARIIKMIKEIFPDIPIILDSKRGDIARSSLNYAIEAFDVWNADCTTVSPYMGSDSIEPFIKEKYKEKGIYLLNRTSNKGAKDFQNLSILEEINSSSSPLFLAISKKVSSYMKEGYSVGAVVGATGLEELKTIASFFTKAVSGGVPLLIPGVGSQGGSAEEVISVLKECDYDLSLVRINSSSNLTHPWKSKDIPSNYMEQCLNNIENLIKETRI
jgi:orotidine 5'-phosphate decarboxylase